MTTSILRKHDGPIIRGSFQSIENGDFDDSIPRPRRQFPFCFIATSLAVLLITNCFTYLAARHYEQQQQVHVNCTIDPQELPTSEALFMPSDAVFQLIHHADPVTTTEATTPTTTSTEKATTTMAPQTPKVKIDFERLKRKWMRQGIDEYQASLRGDADTHPDIFPQQSEPKDYDYGDAVSFDGSFELETVNGNFAVDRRGRMTKL